MVCEGIIFGGRTNFGDWFAIGSMCEFQMKWYKEDFLA